MIFGFAPCPNTWNIRSKKKTNLQTICDSASGKGALQCNPANSCPGSKESNCQPYVVWSFTPYSTGYYHAYLSSGKFDFDSNWYDPLSAFGVRCVLGFDLSKAKDISGMRTVKKIASHMLSSISEWFSASPRVRVPETSGADYLSGLLRPLSLYLAMTVER